MAEKSPEAGLKQYVRGDIAFSRDELLHCHGYGCRRRTYAYIGDDAFDYLSDFFRSTDDAKAERAAIAKAVGWLETYIGEIAGTGGDIQGTYKKIGDDQHDCVDESVNTTVYLLFMRDEGFLKHHDVLQPQARLPLLGGGIGPHQTAVIKDIDSGEEFAVDSWFHDNGHPPEIVEMDDWFYGWRPKS